MDANTRDSISFSDELTISVLKYDKEEYVASLNA